MKEFENKNLPASSVTPPRAFVVDDDARYCHVLRKLMETVDLSVETFPSAREFLEFYDPTLPSCLILDLRMPEMSGLELLRILADRDDYLPIIMLTAFADVPTTVEAMKIGAQDVLEKPHRPQQLIEKVQLALKQDLERCQRILVDADMLDNLKSLTPRENEVLELLIKGRTSKQISRRLQISVRTVDFHRRNLLVKMHIDSPLQLTRLIGEYRFRHSSTTHPK